MDIKFVSQVIYFITKYAPRKKLTTYDRMVWMAIFCSANAIAQDSGKDNIWPTYFFPIDNAELTRLTGIKDDRVLRSCRERLKAAGLIDYTKGCWDGTDPDYKINYLGKFEGRIRPLIVSDNITGNAPDNASDGVSDTAPCSDPNNVPVTAGDHVPDSLPNALIPNGFSLPDSGCTDALASSLAEAPSRGQSSSTDIGGIIDLRKEFSQNTGLLPPNETNRR